MPVRTRERIEAVGVLRKYMQGELTHIARDQRHYSVSEFADKVGCAQGDASKLLNGEIGRFSLDRLAMMLMALDFDIEITIHQRKPQ